MWDNLILRDREKNDGTKLQNIIIQIFLSFEEESVLSVSRKGREKNERSFWSIVWVVVCILYCVINVSVQMNE